jgi:ribosomal protein S18 acetylase RimI-like enzyme
MDVRTADPSEQAKIIDVLTLAFSSDPPVRRLWPAASDFLRTFPDFAMAFGGRAFAAGTALVTADGSAAALWLPPGIEPDRERIGSIVGGLVPDDGAPEDGDSDVSSEMARYHPQGPHWYLPLLGVDPARQGQGLGSALLKHALARCDAERLPAYLESSNIKNVPLYERHGFEVLGVIQPGDFPPLYPMLRTAR